MILLKPSLVFQVGLDVEAGKLLGAIPVSWDFAARTLPPGQKFAVSDELRALSGDPRKIAADPAAFEKDLRAALGNVPNGSSTRVTRTTHPLH
jgi:hypothetical protein